MARHQIPENVGPYEVVQARAGSYAVWNNRSGKNRVWIVCRDRAQAEAVCARLNAGDHGEIWV